MEMKMTDVELLEFLRKRIGEVGGADALVSAALAPEHEREKGWRDFPVFSPPSLETQLDLIRSAFPGPDLSYNAEALEDIVNRMPHSAGLFLVPNRFNHLGRRIISDDFERSIALIGQKVYDIHRGHVRIDLSGAHRVVSRTEMALMFTAIMQGMPPLLVLPIQLENYHGFSVNAAQRRISIHPGEAALPLLEGLCVAFVFPERFIAGHKKSSSSDRMGVVCAGDSRSGENDATYFPVICGEYVPKIDIREISWTGHCLNDSSVASFFI